MRRPDRYMSNSVTVMDMQGKIQMVRQGRTQRSCLGSLTDKAVKSSKRRAAEASRDKVAIGNDPPLENEKRHMCVVTWRSRSRLLAH